MRKLQIAVVALALVVVVALAVGIWRDRRNERRVNFAINTLTNYVAYAEAHRTWSESAIRTLSTAAVESLAWDDWREKSKRLVDDLNNKRDATSAFVAAHAALRALGDSEDKKRQTDWLESMEKKYYSLPEK